MHHQATVVAAPCLIPRRAHPGVTLLVRRSDHRHALGSIGSTTAFGAVVRKAIDEMRSGDRLRLGATVALELGPDAGERE
jgi:hypothetical protein